MCNFFGNDELSTDQNNIFASSKLCVKKRVQMKTEWASLQPASCIVIHCIIFHSEVNKSLSCLM